MYWKFSSLGLKFFLNERKSRQFPFFNFAIRNMASFMGSEIKGILLDITGVLYESGNSGAILGSVNAIQRIQSLHIPFRLVTNETQRTNSSLVSKLNSFGYSFSEQQIISPGIATANYLNKHSLRPFLLVHPDILPEFHNSERTNPNCVVVGDAADYFSYENVNEAFKVLMKSEKPLLISMGKGKYYKEKDELVMDLGGYTVALEYAAGVEAKVIGKPSPDYFLSALNEMGVKPEEAVMVGDDISSDVHAAQKCGMKGVLVRTGKFRHVMF
nr:phospholysine phosphohistidine inorganic pyrophosphate phosphatase [Parasteatoda tepidariorum]